jgi:hypothetical protein
MSAVNVQLDPAAAIAPMIDQLKGQPKLLDKAQKRAYRKLSTWLKRQVIKEVASAAGVTQKVIKSTLRYWLRQTDAGIKVWIGTNPIAAHHLGTVRWTRKMSGARVGRRLFPDAWSWGPGSKTKTAVMIRSGASRLPIEVETLEIHQAVSRRIDALEPEIGARFTKLMQQEINYVLNVEANR